MDLELEGPRDRRDISSIDLLRYGQFSQDEFFVGQLQAKSGVTIANNSRFEPMVMLKHFGLNHPDVPQAVSRNG